MTKLYQRADDGFPVGADFVLKAAYGQIPDAKHFQSPSGMVQEPVEVIGWEWSNTFGRWGARVRFADGWKGMTWPILPPPAPITCSVLRNAFLGVKAEEVYAAIPDLPREAFGAAKVQLLIPYAERAGIIPEGEMLIPPKAGYIRYGISPNDIPYEGKWMEHVEPIPPVLTEGIKVQVLATCIIKGNRYGCCWFIGWAPA